MERHDVSRKRKKQQIERKIHKQEKSSLQREKEEIKKPEKQNNKKNQKSIMEAEFQETESRFGVLGKKQVGGVEKEELKGKTEIRPTVPSEIVIGCEIQDDEVYNKGKPESEVNKYYNRDKFNHNIHFLKIYIYFFR